MDTIGRTVWNLGFQSLIGLSLHPRLFFIDPASWSSSKSSPEGHFLHFFSLGDLTQSVDHHLHSFYCTVASSSALPLVLHMDFIHRTDRLEKYRLVSILWRSLMNFMAAFRSFISSITVPYPPPGLHETINAVCLSRWRFLLQMLRSRVQKYISCTISI
jgi:hypothetical protein